MALENFNHRQPVHVMYTRTVEPSCCLKASQGVFVWLVKAHVFFSHCELWVALSYLSVLSLTAR